MQAPQLSLNTLTKKHRLFVEAYDGDVVSACLAAGWSGDPNYLKQVGEKLIADPLIVEAIRERSKYLGRMNKSIADREELQTFWTLVMRNQDPHWREEKDSNGIPVPTPNIPMQNRLKAAELIGKSEGMFIEKVDMNVNMSMADLVMQSYHDDTPIEAIEAEYRSSSSGNKTEPPKQIPAGDYL